MNRISRDASHFCPRVIVHYGNFKEGWNTSDVSLFGDRVVEVGQKAEQLVDMEKS